MTALLGVAGGETGWVVRERLTVLVACLLLVTALAVGAQLLRGSAGGGSHDRLFPAVVEPYGGPTATPDLPPHR